MPGKGPAASPGRWGGNFTCFGDYPNNKLGEYLKDIPPNVFIIRDIDAEAMKADFFDTLNGKPTALPPKQ